MDWEAATHQSTKSTEAVAGSSSLLVPLTLTSSSTPTSTAPSISISKSTPLTYKTKVSSLPTSNKEEVTGRLRLGLEKGKVGLSSRISPISLLVVEEEEQKQPTDLSNPKKTSQQVLVRKHKPIPPPLDLSIGANNLNNLSLHPHPQPQSTFNPPHHNHLNHNHQQIPNHQYHQQPFIGSPKFTHSDKNLPLRKRWHSWSPVPMNGQEDSMVPLYPDNHNMPKTGLAGVGDTAVSSHHQHNHANANSQHHQNQNQYHQPYSSPGPGGHNYGSNRNPNWSLDFVPNVLRQNNTNGHNNINSNGQSHSHNTPTSGDNQGHTHIVQIQTPTPFYTPNEPSPKFMNSPVFSYSNPDTSLYQGPFSPMRASSLYPPPSSPFTNLSLNSPLGPLSAPQSSLNSINSINSINSAGMGNSCFNMIPSTLLSPAPSQASTNSLSYEDLHEKSLNFISPVWSIFLPGTKVRFVTGINSMDWYVVDFLAQSDDLLGLKGEYAPHGLEVRKLIVTSSAKERIQVTFHPIADPHHPTIEVNCEPGHPFMVDKKGWCAVKPEVFQEVYGTHCQNLECGDVCLSIGAARSPSQYSHQHQNHPNNAQVFPSLTSGSVSAIHNHNHTNHNGSNGLSSGLNIKMEPIEDKIIIPISVVPQTHNQNHHHHNNNSMPSPISINNMNIHNIISPSALSRKTFASPASAPNSPAKKSKDSKEKKQNNATPPGETKGRRPMNGFLLFAKDKRPELIQMYPGKDNRSISVLLGEAWQSLAPSEREKYSLNAKARAEEQKRIHPDCWKRKRSQSTSS